MSNKHTRCEKIVRCTVGCWRFSGDSVPKDSPNFFVEKFILSMFNMLPSIDYHCNSCLNYVLMHATIEEGARRIIMKSRDSSF